MNRRSLVLALVISASAACTRSEKSNLTERIAFLPFENLTGDAAEDWIATSGPKIVTDQLLGGAAHAVPVQAGSLRDAYGSGATQLVHGYFEKRRANQGQSLHFEFSIEDARTHKTIQNVVGDGDALQAFDVLAKKIDAGAHPFSSSNPQAVAAWARNEYETAVSLDPDFGAAWLSWVQARAAAGDREQASVIVERALQRTALRSTVDRAQLEFVSAGIRQDKPAQQKALSALARLMPHDTALLGRLAAQEMNARQYSEAVRYYQAVLQEAPDDSESWNMLGYAQAFAGDADSSRKSFERYGSDPAHAANAFDSQGEGAFLNGKFSEAEKAFLEAHAKNGAMLGGGDLLKAAYARWLQGDLPGADQIFSRYVEFRTQMKDPLVPWRQAVWEFSTGRQSGAITRLSGVSAAPSSPALIQIAQTQLLLWKDPSKLPQDPAALKQAYDRIPPTGDGITRVLLAAALAKSGQKDEAKKLLVLWPLPGADSDPLLQSFLFPKYLEVKQELK